MGTIENYTIKIPSYSFSVERDFCRNACIAEQKSISRCLQTWRFVSELTLRMREVSLSILCQRNRTYLNILLKYDPLDRTINSLRTLQLLVSPTKPCVLNAKTA